jgi:hypothetical protein
MVHLWTCLKTYTKILVGRPLHINLADESLILEAKCYCKFYKSVAHEQLLILGPNLPIEVLLGLFYI